MITDQDLSELKRSRPQGPGWEWCVLDPKEGEFFWRFDDSKSNQTCFLGCDEGIWTTEIKDSDGKTVYKVQFEDKAAMGKWARDFSSLKVRRGIQTAHKYYARPIGAIKNSPGTWDSYKIGVFRRNPDGDEQIGEYVRHYSFLDTFHWFTKDGKDYALFSAPDYTATRIMELPSCKDIGGEKPESHGFCPVEFYVPSYVDRILIDDNPKINGAKFRIYEPSAEEISDVNERGTSKAVTPLLHEPFGFVAGCVWGDDTSWKIEYLDLSEADKGILKREDRFGYIELPSNLVLREAIDLGDGECNIRIAHEETFDLKTGKNLSRE